MVLRAPGAPTYNQRTVTPNAMPNAYENVNATAEAFGGQVGGAVGRLGGAVGDWAKVFQKRDEDDGRLWALQQASEMAITAHQRDLERRETGPADGKDHGRVLLADFKSDLDARLEAAPNEYGQKYLQQYGFSMSDDVAKRATSYEYEARQRYRVTAFENELERHKQRMVDTPYMYDGSKGFLDAMGEELSEAERQKLLPKARNELALAAVQSQVARDPDAALKSLQGASASSKAGVISLIREKAQAAGMDPAYYIRLAQIESGFDPSAINDKSKAAGLFQFVPGTQAQYGLSDPHDVEESVDKVIRFTKDNQIALMKGLGRMPEPWELYLAHQQGAAGAGALISNPDAKAVDVLKRFMKEDTARDAIRNNGGNEDMTAQQFTEKWRNEFQKQVPVPGGGSLTPSASADPVISAAWGDLSAEGKLWAMRHAETAAKQKKADMKVALAQVTADASEAWLNGLTPNAEPTEAQMVYAHGAEKGAIMWAEYQDTRSMGQTVSSYRTLPEAEIRQQHEARRPQLGDGYAHKMKLWEAEGNAMEQLLKRRIEDPMGAVMDAHPRLKGALVNAKAGDLPDLYTTLWTAQGELGIPEGKRSLMTKSVAATVAKRSKDETLSQEERIAPIAQLIEQAKNPEHRQAIWRQLEREGVPEMLGVAMFAAETNTPAAFHRVAALALSPEAGKPIQADAQTGRLREQVHEMFSRDSIGGALFPGLDAEGHKVRDNFMNMALRLMNSRMSQNGGDVSEARRYAEETLWGNSRQVKGAGVNVVLRKDASNTDDDTLINGLNFLRREAETQLIQQIETALPAADTKGGSAERHVVLESGKRAARDMVERSVWVKYGEGMALLDPLTDGYVLDASGKPLTVDEGRARKTGAEIWTLPDGV